MFRGTIDGPHKAHEFREFRTFHTPASVISYKIMFGIGLPELIIIIVVALLVVGPKKLPELARSLGKAMGEFRRMADDVKETLETEMHVEETGEEVKGENKAAEASEEGQPKGGEAMKEQQEEPSEEEKKPAAELSVPSEDQKKGGEPRKKEEKQAAESEGEQKTEKKGITPNEQTAT
ncbi:MAG: Sec-independent protein translocase protein TatB [Syntrophorhabdaceae bacterium PtaU1.Bin034]|nr:MAG: Sec-independent protein translocase protein TatB [Syntrophorhabdaceae bacterium PtaU1.Bin034]